MPDDVRLNRKVEGISSQDRGDGDAQSLGKAGLATTLLIRFSVGNTSYYFE